MTVWEFERLPGTMPEDLVERFFLLGTCGNYHCRNFIIDLGFMPEGQRTFPTTPGPHEITVTATDHAGNRTEKTYRWTVT